jgi:hypothetical protein
MDQTSQRTPLGDSEGGGRQLDCELRDHGEWGVEVQMYRKLEFLYGRRWATRALALEEADQQKARYLRELLRSATLLGLPPTTHRRAGDTRP